MGKVARLSPGMDWAEITIILTDDEGIRGFGAAVLDRPEVTDVLSLQYDPIPGEEAKVCGELVINVQRAIEAGESHARGPRSVPWGECREMALYVAHGCDHLSGADDDDRTGYLRMRRRELRWLAQAHAEGLIEGLLRRPRE